MPVDQKTILSGRDMETQLVVMHRNQDGSPKPVIDIGTVDGRWIQGATVESVGLITNPSVGKDKGGDVVVAILVITQVCKPKKIACVYIGPEGQILDISFISPHVVRGKIRSPLVLFDRISCPGDSVP